MDSHDMNFVKDAHHEQQSVLFLTDVEANEVMVPTTVHPTRRELSWTETEDGSPSPYEFLLCSLLGSFVAVFICYRLRRPCYRHHSMRTDRNLLLDKPFDNDEEASYQKDSEPRYTLPSVMTQKEIKKAKLEERDQRFRSRTLNIYKETQRGKGSFFDNNNNDDASRIEIIQEENGKDERVRVTAGTYRSPICGIYSGHRTQSTLLISPDNASDGDQNVQIIHSDLVRVTLIFKPSLETPGFEVEGIGSDFVSDFVISKGFVNYLGDICWVEERYKRSLPSSIKCVRGTLEFQEETKSHRIQLMYETNDGIIKGSITLSLQQQLEMSECLRKRKFSILKNSVVPRSIFRGRQSGTIAFSFRSQSVSPRLDGTTNQVQQENDFAGVNRYLVRATELEPQSPHRKSSTSSTMPNVDAVLSTDNGACNESCGELLIGEQSISSQDKKADRFLSTDKGACNESCGELLIGEQTTPSQDRKQDFCP